MNYFTFNVLLLITIFSFVLIQHSVTKAHEKVHQNIFEDYGIESNITVYWFGKDGYAGFTTPLNQTLAKQKCKESCNALHTQNDIASYNMIGVYQTLFIICLLILLISYINSNPIP